MLGSSSPRSEMSRMAGMSPSEDSTFTFSARSSLENNLAYQALLEREYPVRPDSPPTITTGGSNARGSGRGSRAGTGRGRHLYPPPIDSYDERKEDGAASGRNNLNVTVAAAVTRESRVDSCGTIPASPSQSIIRYGSKPSSPMPTAGSKKRDRERRKLDEDREVEHSSGSRGWEYTQRSLSDHRSRRHKDDRRRRHRKDSGATKGGVGAPAQDSQRSLSHRKKEPPATGGIHSQLPTMTSTILHRREDRPERPSRKDSGIMSGPLGSERERGGRYSARASPESQRSSGGVHAMGSHNQRIASNVVMVDESEPNSPRSELLQSPQPPARQPYHHRDVGQGPQFPDIRRLRSGSLGELERSLGSRAAVARRPSLPSSPLLEPKVMKPSPSQGTFDISPNAHQHHHHHRSRSDFKPSLLGMDRPSTNVLGQSSPNPIPRPSPPAPVAPTETSAVASQASDPETQPATAEPTAAPSNPKGPLIHVDSTESLPTIVDEDQPQKLPFHTRVPHSGQLKFNAGQPLKFNTGQLRLGDDLKFRSMPSNGRSVPSPSSQFLPAGGAYGVRMTIKHDRSTTYELNQIQTPTNSGSSGTSKVDIARRASASIPDTGNTTRRGPQQRRNSFPRRNLRADRPEKPVGAKSTTTTEPSEGPRATAGGGEPSRGGGEPSRPGLIGTGVHGQVEGYYSHSEMHRQSSKSSTTQQHQTTTGGVTQIMSSSKQKSSSSEVQTRTGGEVMLGFHVPEYANEYVQVDGIVHGAKPPPSEGGDSQNSQKEIFKIDPDQLPTKGGGGGAGGQNAKRGMGHRRTKSKEKRADDLRPKPRPDLKKKDRERVLQRSASRTSDSDNDSNLGLNGQRLQLPRPMRFGHQKGASLTLEPMHLRRGSYPSQMSQIRPPSIRNGWDRSDPRIGLGQKRGSLRTLSNFGSNNPYEASPRGSKTPRNLHVHTGRATNDIPPDGKLGLLAGLFSCGSPSIRPKFVWSCCGKDLHSTGCEVLENIDCFCGHMLQTRPTSPRNLYWQDQAKRKRFQPLLQPPAHKCTFCWEPMEDMYEVTHCERGNCDFEMHSMCAKKYKFIYDRIMQNMRPWGRPYSGEPSYYTEKPGEPSELAVSMLPTPKKSGGFAAVSQPLRKGKAGSGNLSPHDAEPNVSP